MEWKNMDNNTVFWVLIIGAGKGFSGKGRHFLKFWERWAKSQWEG